jgi:glycerol-3-phosphate dehydrogenase (NAD(P)+)
MSIMTIVGAGVMGSAMSFPARDNGHEVRLAGTPLDREIIENCRKNGWHIKLKRRLPDGIKYFQFDEFENAVRDADLLICGVSSFGVEWFLNEVLAVIPGSLPVLSVTKGMFDTPEGGLISYPEYYESRLGSRRLSLNAIGGPCTSYELADRHHSAVFFCGRDMDVLRRLKSLLETDYYHISLSTDVRGIECAVALKNAYALGVTLAVGLAERECGEGCELHYNPQAALFGQSVREMRKLLKTAGCADDNIIPGAGDLYVTIFGGRTRRLGTLLGRGIPFEKAMDMLDGVTLESVVIAKRTAAALKTRIEKGLASPSDFPLLLHIDDIISNGASVDIPWKSFETEIL